MKQQILEFVQRRGGVSFAELRNLLGDAGKGYHALHVTGYPNLIIWPNMSEPFIKAVQELLAEGHLVMKPTSYLVYLADGLHPNMPMARRKCQYKEPHWIPVVLDCPARQVPKAPSQGLVADTESACHNRSPAQGV